MKPNPVDLTNLHVLALEMREARIALQEAIEDLVGPIIRWLERRLT